MLQSRESPDTYKIGFSCDPTRRVVQLNEEMGGLYWRLLVEIFSEDAPRLEKAFHTVFASKRISPRREWFKLDAADVELFLALPSGQAVVEIPALQWRQEVVRKMLDLGQPVAAAMVEEVRGARLEGNVLRMFFPPTAPSFYLRFAESAAGRAHLQDAVEAVFGKRPTEVRSEVQ